MPSVSQAEMAGRLILSIALLGMSSPAVGFLPMTGNPSTLRRPQAAITCEPSLRVSRGASSVRMVTTNEKDGTVVEDALARYEIFAKLESQEEAASVDMANMKHEGPIALKHLYHNSDRVLVVSYVKDKCSMCRVLKPLMEKVVQEFEEEGKLHFVTLEVTANKPIVRGAGLKAVPVTHIFSKGLLIDELKGLQSKKGLREKFAAAIQEYAGAKGDETMSEIERMLEENRKLREENARLLEGRQNEGTSKKIKSSPRLFAPGRTLYPARWRNLLNDNDKDKKQEAKGVVGEVLDIESVLTQNDEIDDSFLRALQKENMAPAFLRDSEGRLIKSRLPSGAQSDAKEKRVMGRIADGESNLSFSSPRPEGPDVAGQEGWPQQICDESGCMLLYGDEETALSKAEPGNLGDEGEKAGGLYN